VEWLGCRCSRCRDPPAPTLAATAAALFTLAPTLLTVPRGLYCAIRVAEALPVRRTCPAQSRGVAILGQLEHLLDLLLGLLLLREREERSRLRVALEGRLRTHGRRGGDGRGGGGEGG